MVGYNNDSGATIAPVASLGKQVTTVALHGAQLSKTDVYFSTPVLWIALSNTMKSGQ